MREYHIVPKFSYSKFLPLFSAVCQITAIGFVVVGRLVTSAAFILACILQFCAFYYAGLSIFNKNYRLKVSADAVTVVSFFNKPKTYRTETLRWKMRKIPWYNIYFILLYSSMRLPVAIVKPHWKNALELIRFPHLGELSESEIEYLKFLKKMGLLLVDIKRITKR